MSSCFWPGSSEDNILEVLELDFTFAIFSCIWKRSVAIFYPVILEQTSATKLRRAAIERENGFCQAPLLAPFTIQQLIVEQKKR